MATRKYSQVSKSVALLSGGLQAIELLETPEKSLVEHGAKNLRETTTRGALT